MNVAKMAAAPTLRRIGIRFPNSAQVNPPTARMAINIDTSEGTEPDSEADDQNDKKHVNGKRNNPNSKIQKLPPTLWPKAIVDISAVRERRFINGTNFPSCVRLHTNLPCHFRELSAVFS
jgi:hypothetical protein